ncbi:putative S-phase kinase-associated protein [Dioscorea sansibarensis]
MVSVENMVTLRSKDKKEFRVNQRAAAQSKLLKSLIDEGCCWSDQPIPILIVSGRVLQSVITYCEKHAKLLPLSQEDAHMVRKRKEDEDEEELLKIWDFDFVKKMVEEEDIEFIGSVLHAADYLEIEGLLDLTVTTVADMIRGKTAEQMRAILRIKNDLTPEQEQAIRAANPWAFSD